MNDPIESMLNKLMERQQRCAENPMPQLNAEGRAATLKDRFMTFNEPNTFIPGQLICLKPGMKNKKFPHYGEPVIVTKVYEQPMIDTECAAGSAYFIEPLDIVFGCVDPDGDFVEYHADSRRFQPFA